MSDKQFPIQLERNAAPHPLTIPWSIAELAYSVYASKYGNSQSLERLAERGGFAPSEMDEFLPDWRLQCMKAIVKDRGTLANNLCPDHRDKQFGKPCLACTIERLCEELAEETKKLRFTEQDNVRLLGMRDEMQDERDGLREEVVQLRAELAILRAENTLPKGTEDKVIFCRECYGGYMEGQGPCACGWEDASDKRKRLHLKNKSMWMEEDVSDE